MHIVLGFLPFIAFAALAASGRVLAGLIVAFVLAAAPILRRRSAKLLEGGGAMLFGALALWSLLAPAPPGPFAVRLAVDAGLTVIVLASLAVGRPFTLAYAREQVSPALWDNPMFLAVNRRITVAWAAAFAVMTTADAATLLARGTGRFVAVAAGIAALAAAIWFTGWYPRRVRARFASASQGPVL